MSDVKAYLHVVYAAHGDASILEFQTGDKRRFYLVDGGPISYVGAGGTEEQRIKKLTKLQLSKPYYQYLLYTLTGLARIPNSTGIRLDGAIVTHPHADHLDGVERLFRELLPHQYQDSVKSESPDKRLMCNGPVLLTKKFAQNGEAYRSLSEFLLKTKFEISLDKDDIQNAFGNDILFSFPSSPGVLYQRHKPSEDDEPFSEEKQRSKLKGGTEDDDLNKSSIILYTEKGGKICLSGDGYGYDISSMLRRHGVKNLDIFKLPHHGSPYNSILGKVLPPSWAFQNLASMVLLSISLELKITFDKNPEEENDIDYFRQQLKGKAEHGNGPEQVQQVAEAFLVELKARLKNTPGKITPEVLLSQIQGKHIQIVTALQQQSGQVDLCENLDALNPLKDWETLANNVANRLQSQKHSPGSEPSVKARKVDFSTFVGKLMGNDIIFRDFFAGKVGIDAFFESFHSKIYYVSANRRYGHPSPHVIKGIIKAAVKKNKSCSIVFTSGGVVPTEYLPDAQHTHYKDWNKLVSLYYLKGNVSFKLDPSNDVNIVPTGTTKFENDDTIRIDVAAQLKKNYGFTIPRRSFLPTLDKYYVKTEISDKKFHWLKVKRDGTLFLESTKSDQNVLTVSNAPSINGDLRMITLKSDSEDGGQKNVWLEKAVGGGFLMKGSADGDYFFERSVFSFDHKTFSGQMRGGKEVSIMEFFRSVGYTGDDQSINVRSVLEMLLGVPSMKCLVEELPNDFIGIATLDQEVNLKLSTVEMTSSVDCEVVSSHIEVILPTPSMIFDSRQVTQLEVAVKEPCSANPRLSLLISTSLHDAKFTVDLSGYLKPRKPSVDMYLNALGGVPKESRNNMTMGTLLERVMGLLPLESLSSFFPAQLLACQIFTWKVDRVLSTANYFISPLAVEVLSGDFYINIPPEMNKVTFGDTVTVDLSRIHVMVSDPRTYKSDFVIECDASIGSILVNMKMVRTPTSVPEVIISFPESLNVAAVFKALGLKGNILELSVPVVDAVIKNLQLSKPRISVVQDVPSSKVTHVSSLSFDFSFDKFPPLLPSSLPLPLDIKASVSIFNPFSAQLHVGFDVEFKLPVSASTANNSFLNSKFSLWPVEVSDQESSRGYSCSTSLWPSSSGISIQSALQAVGLAELTASMTSFFPCISSMLTGVLLKQVTLEGNTQSRTIDSLTLSFFVPEFLIIEGKLSMHEANVLVQYGSNQWYAETEMKLLVFNKFVCHAAFSLPRPDIPGSLTFENTDDSFTLKEMVEGIGIVVSDDIPVIKGVLDVKISKVAIGCANDGASFKLTKVVTVLEKRTLSIGSIKLYNLELEVCYINAPEHSSVSFSLQGYLNSKTHASLAYDVERRELLGRYVLTENILTSDCLSELFEEELKNFSSSNAFVQVKSLHVQEVKVVLSFPRGKEWSLKQFLLSIEGSLSLGPINLKQLRLEYVKDQDDDDKRHASVVGHFQSDDQTLSFTMELSCTGQQSKSTIFEAAIRPDSPRGLTLLSLLQLIGLKIPDIPQVDGSPDFFNIELKEAFLQFEVSPFRIRKADVVIKTTSTLTIIEKPLIQLDEARLEYHFDGTKDYTQTEVFIAGVFIIGEFRLDVTLRKETKEGLVLEGRLQDAKSAKKIDFEKAAKQLSPDIPFTLPKNVALTSFVFRLEKSEETTSLKLEGESHTDWPLDAGFGTITIKNLGGKLNFQKDRTLDAWTGFVCLTGKFFLLETVAVFVEVYHDSKGETAAFGTVQDPQQIDLEAMTQRIAAGSDPSKSWNELVPEETESSVRSPKFNSASLFINFSHKTLLFFGTVVGFGTGLLMVKKTDGNDKSSEYGFLFGLSLGGDFRFSSLNKSLSVVDEVLSVQHANLSVTSLEHETVEEMREDFSKLQALGDKKQELDSPFTDLDIQSISKRLVRPGVTAYAKVTFSGGESKLLSNVSQIQRGETLADIVLFAHIAAKGNETVFMAQIKDMKLFGGNLRFEEITLTYQPSKGKAFTFMGKMSLTLTDDSNPIVFHGSLEISESKADFSIAVGGNPGTIHEPFGMFGISFEDPQLQLSWQFDEDKQHSIVPFCKISGVVKFSKSASSSKEEPVTTLRGSIVFQECKPVVAAISLDLSHPLSIDDMFVTLFKEQWPSGYLDISFKEGEIYYAKAKVEVDGKTYKEGFHGQTEVQIFGNAFGVEISVDKSGMAIKGYTKFEIDLIIATLTRKDFEEDKGPEVDISRYHGKTKFELSSGIKLLQEKIGSCSLGYDVQQKCFLGGVTYNGQLLGINNPTIEFEWSKKRGFKIRNWPIIADLQDLIDFAKAFEELSQMIDSPCEKLVGLVFDKVVKTKCRLNVKQASVKDSGNPDAWLALRLQGKVDIMIVTDTPSVTVDFPEMVVAITKPPKQFRLSDLPGFLVVEIAKNSLEMVKQVFTQPEQLMKFMAALGGIKLSRKVLSGLICRGVHSPNVTDQAANELESMEGEAGSAETALETAFEELTTTAAASSSIAALAASAVTVLANVGLVVAALAGIISFIAGIISFFTGKSKQQKEAEKRRNEAEKKAEKARKLVEDRLMIVDLSIAVPNIDEVEVSWKPLEENVKYSVRLTRIDLGGKETTLLETTTENNKINFKSDAVKYNTKQFITSVQASYHSGGKTFTGKGHSLTKNVTPLLHAPSKLEVESKQEGQEVHVTFSQVEYAVDYKAEVITHDHSVIGIAIIKKPPDDKDGIHVFHADELASGVSGMTQVRMCARGHDESLNEFKYSTNLYLVVAPSHLLHSYEPTLQQLSVQWNVNDAKNISSYLCEIHSIEASTVVFSKEVAKSLGDSLESALKIHLNEISDKTKSPYRIVVCSLGVSATLASVFVTSNGNLSFLPQVDGISPSYDPQSNQLTVSWVPVTGATKYSITIREKTSISSVVKNLTSDGEKDKVVFEMRNVPLQSGVKYVATVVAEGSDAFHLPSLPSTAGTELSQLPKPSSVSQEYSFEEKKIKVTFKPVPDASAHLIEVFNEITPTKIAGRHVVPKPTGVDWPSTVTYSFDVDNMRFNGGARFKSRVIAQGNAHWMNSSPCLSSTAFTCSDAAISVALKYSVESNTMIIVISSRPGHFTAKIEDTSHKGRTISTQQFLVKRETGKDSVHQTLLEIPLTSDEEPRGAIYQAFVLNTGDQQHLPSEVKKSNEVPLLDPPASVSQEYKDGVFTVVWKCVRSATGYHIRVYNAKTGSTASEVNVTREVRPAGEQMKKEFDVDSIILESDGLYQTLVMVLGDEVSIGGASTKSNTNIMSFPSPEDVKLTFNNETRHMLVRCSSVKGAVSIRLGVVDADKLKHDETNIQGALLGSKEVDVTSSNDSKPVEAEFDDSVLITSLDGLHRGVAQLMEKRAEISLPSGYSISDDVVAWLKPPVSIHLSFDPVDSTLKITWTPVNLALRYLVEIQQKREATTLIPFSDEVPGDVSSCIVNMEKVNVDESDKFVAKVQPDGNPGTVITLDSTGYSSETLVCENSPTDLEVLQVEDETVKVTWKGDSATTFQFRVWRMPESGHQEDIISKQTDKLQLISTSEALRMISPGRYRFGVRAQGSISKLHSVYTHSHVLAVIMDAPIVTAMKRRPAVTVKWTPVDNNPTEDFSNYVIHYLQRGAKSQWNQVQVETSAKEKTIVDLQPDSDYLFCISVASPKRGDGIRSPATAVHTESDVRLPGNLLDNPDFVPAEGWDEHGYSYNIITHPWQIISPTDRQYRLENTQQGTADWPDYDGNSRWRVAAANFGRRSCWRVQMVDLLARGFTPEYLDEVKPDIEVYEWFTIQSGGSGAYDIKVSLLDSNKKNLPGENSYLARSKVAASDGSWKRQGHTFSNYPSGLRFIRFEDGMQSLGLDVRAYDVKSFRATMKISKSPDEDGKSLCRQNYSKECEAVVNEQINLEMHSSYVFLSMSSYKYDDDIVDDVTVPGLNEFLLNQSDVCVLHAQMLMQYQRDRGGHIVLHDIKKPEFDSWGTGFEACESALAMAKQINDTLLDLRIVAEKNGDSHMVDFINDSLLQKQAESINALSGFVTKFKTASEGYGN